MPGRPKGLPKTGGRKAGTPNKKRSIEELCTQLSFDPFEAMIKIAQESDQEINRLNASKELCQYILPKRKALEHTFEPTDQELKEFIKERLDGSRASGTLPPLSE